MTRYKIASMATNTGDATPIKKEGMSKTKLGESDVGFTVTVIVVEPEIFNCTGFVCRYIYRQIVLRSFGNEA